MSSARACETSGYTVHRQGDFAVATVAQRVQERLVAPLTPQEQAQFNALLTKLVFSTGTESHGR